MADGSDPGSETTRRNEEHIGNVWQTPEAVTFQTPAQYFEALERWMQAAKMMQLAMVSFPYLMMANQPVQFLPSQPNFTHTSIPQHFQQFRTPNIYVPTIPTGVPQSPTQVPQANTRAGVVYRIAPVWRRMCAESLDFLLLTIIKLIAGLAAAYLFGFIHWNILNHTRKFDLNMTLDSALMMLESDEITPEILMLEILNITIASAFEAFWMRKDLHGTGRGATPGKAIMKIRVVYCDKVLPLDGRPPEVVLVQPGTELPLLWSLARSFTKNIVLAMLLPLTFVLFFFKHYRTGYDVMCHTIVVEDTTRFQN